MEKAKHSGVEMPDPREIARINNEIEANRRLRKDREKDRIAIAMSRRAAGGEAAITLEVSAFTIEEDIRLLDDEYLRLRKALFEAKNPHLK